MKPDRKTIDYMAMHAEFAAQHQSDDISKLVLSRNKWPEINIDLVVNTIESRRKLQNKVTQWFSEPRMIFPIRLSAEQCSSTATATYKAELAERICSTQTWKLADLTGGLGVDTWHFSKKASEVLYNEMQPSLCEAAEYNFHILGCNNITISNHIADIASVPGMLESFIPDIVYLDPARRGDGGKKVFLIEECTPDILTLKDSIFKTCRNILVKLSPMADISMVCSRLGRTCREVHIVAAEGECKELLVWMDREWDDDYAITALEIAKDGTYEPIVFLSSEEKSAAAELYPHIADADSRELYLFEPGKALMKAGAFNLIGIRFDIRKLGRSTHYYIAEDKQTMERLLKFGKIFRILKNLPLDKRSLKIAGRDFPRAEVTARNIPMTSDELRKKTGVTSGDDAHIFGLKSDTDGNILLCTKRVFKKDL